MLQVAPIFGATGGYVPRYDALLRNDSSGALLPQSLISGSGASMPYVPRQSLGTRDNHMSNSMVLNSISTGK